MPKKTKSFNGLIFKWLPNSVNKIKNGQNSHHKSVHNDFTGSYYQTLGAKGFNLDRPKGDSDVGDIVMLVTL